MERVTAAKKRPFSNAAVANVRKLYFDPATRGSLSAKKTFLKYNPKLNEAAVDAFFAEENAAKQFFPSKVALKGETQKLRANYFGQYLMADTGFFEIQVNGQRQKYIVMGVADVWSRYFIARVMQRASAEEAVQAIKSIISSEIKPFMPHKNRSITILSDMGTEFVNKIMSRWLQTERLVFHHTLASSVNKASIVERKWRTLKAKIQLYVDSKKFGQNFNFGTLLQQICKTLNATEIRTIGNVTPADLRAFKIQAVNKMRQKTQKHLMQSEGERKEFYRRVKDKLIGRIGQFVRVTSSKAQVFEKLHQRKYSRLELFIIHGIKLPTPASNTPYSMYKLRDLNGEIIKGFFKTSEIIPLQDQHTPHRKSYRFTVTEWKRNSQNRGEYLATLAGTS